MAALEYWLWLSSAGLSPRAKTALIERYGDAEAVFHTPDGAFTALPELSRAEAGVLERRDLSLAYEIAEACERQGIHAVSLQDAAYPQRLRHILTPPVVLYVKGSLSLLGDRASIAVLGTRRGSVYGQRMSERIAGEIARCGGVVISLLTSDIERTAAQAALRENGGIVGVLGVPHERETGRLAAEIAQRGALVSEYPPFTRPFSSFFRDRNRVASGLSAGVLVIEAPEKSGTHLFVAEAAEQGKEIFAVPGNADAESSAGTLRMIREGAKLVTSGWEVLCEFEALYPDTVRFVPASAVSQRAEKPVPETETAREKREEPIDKPPEKAYIDLSKQLAGLSETQLRIVAAIDRQAKHIDDIIEATGLPTATVLAQLTVLEIKGFVRHEPGRRFTLNTTKK